MTTIRRARSVPPSERPVNVMAMASLNAPALFAAGVKRVSLGPWFARAAIKGLTDAIAEVQDTGTFQFVQSCPSGAEVAKMLKNP